VPAPERADDVAKALEDSGIDPEHPADLGSSGREVVTIWWGGAAPMHAFGDNR